MTIVADGRSGPLYCAMPSVTDALRAQTVARVLALPPHARIALALALGDDDAARFARASGCDLSSARRRLADTRRRGRTPSRCAGGPARVHAGSMDDGARVGAGGCLRRVTPARAT